MKKLLLALAVGLGVVLSAGPSLAWHRDHDFHVGVVIGNPAGFGCSPFYAPCYAYPPYYGGYYYPPAYYPPPVVVSPPPPPVYIEKEQASQYWYYCADARKYYPYVKSCPSGWMKVVPQTAAPSNAPAQ